MIEILIKTSELQVAAGGKTLLTLGVGSCVVACMWDPDARLGGMAHMFLPTSHDDPCGQALNPGTAPDSALPYMLDLMERRGARRERIVVRLIGGGNMFECVEAGMTGDIGVQILSNSLAILEQLGLPVAGRSVGGRLGRNVSFNIENGEITVRTTDGRTEAL